MAKFKRYLKWRSWVVPQALRSRAIHQWFVFPHSFTDDIVRALSLEWKLTKNDLVLDPFVGAGTTILAAKELGIPAIGFDLSPIAVLASNVKAANYDLSQLTTLSETLSRQVGVKVPKGETKQYSKLVQKALPGKKLATLHSIKNCIRDLSATDDQKAFFKLALIAQLPHFSNAIPTGGWLSWELNRRSASSIPKRFHETVQMMLADVKANTNQSDQRCSAKIADARKIPAAKDFCSAIITSPPYPNRHDYTRVFGVELMFAFLDWDGTRKLRYQTLHSHPEAKPSRPSSSGYSEPHFITKAISLVAKQKDRKRVISMLHGYFIDLFLCFKEMERVLISGGNAAIVLGNAQYDGAAIEVDKAAAQIGEQAGLVCTEVRVVRERGNSAQQMKQFGRSPSRESIVLFTKP